VKNPLEVLDSSLFQVASWVMVSKDFHGLSNDLVRDWHSCLISFLLSYDI